MRVLLFAVLLLFSLARPIHAQTPQPSTPKAVDESRRLQAEVVQPRKERPTVMEALINKDKRLAVMIKKFETSQPDTSAATPRP
jgi:hypothetical protein